MKKGDMKKRVLSMLLVLCMVFAMAPTMAAAAEIDKRTIEMKVKERKQYDGPDATNFASSNQDVVAIYQDGEISARQAGTATVYAYKDSKTVASWTIKVDGGKEPERPANTGGWPFMPSPHNKTNGEIQSGWYKIYSHDLGQFYVNGDGMVTPTRRVQSVFYIEHLGNEAYYVYDPSGNYMSYNGSAQHAAQIVMSKTPKKWRVRMNYDWQKKYVFCPVEDETVAITTFGLCSEDHDSMVKLAVPVSLDQDKTEFTLQGDAIDSYIPQWYKDFENGLPRPSTTEITKVFGDVPAALKYTTKLEWDVLRLTNLHRVDAGLPMFVTTDVMQKAAGVRSDELIKSYSHARPDGSDPFTVFNSLGVAYQTGAENIAEGQGSAAAVVKDWMESQGHRENILTSGLRYMGTGMSYDDAAHWEQIFITTEDSDCQSISFDRELGYFTLKLKNGATAYAPYPRDFPPKEDEDVTFHYPGVSSIKGGAGNSSQPPPEAKPENDGWYYLRLMNNYINGVSDDNLQLYNLEYNMRVFPEVVGDGLITLKISDDEYVGLYAAPKDGARVCIVEEPYHWAIYSERGDDVFSLRPAANTKMVLNACEWKKADGTPVIVWTHENLDAPGNAEVQFVPLNPGGASYKIR